MIDRGVEQRAASARSHRQKRPVPHAEWTKEIPDNEWEIYECALQAFEPLGRPFMLAGAFSLATYTGRWRNTKDLDIYVLPEDRQTFIDALTRSGFKDYYDQLPYVRHWIYRSVRGECIVDVIWAMANQRAQVDEQWFEHAPELEVRGHTLSVVPAEELLWCKLYVLQRDRCDWPDVLNLIQAAGAHIDWEHLIQRLGDDLPLLVGLLNVYCWLSPGDRLKLPGQVQALLPHCGHQSGQLNNQQHIDWLDTRPWFAARPQNS
jgi:hypothetical protein